MEPFRSNKNKFNFWYVTQFISLTDCDTPSGMCPNVTFVPLAENCPYGNKYVVIVMDKHEAQETGAGERTVSYGFPLSPNLSFDPDAVSRIFVHEFGHAFARLGDEYVLFPDQSPGYETPTSIFAGHKNVYAGPQHTQEECLANAPWKDIIGNGCGLDCEPENQNYNLEIGCFEGAGKVGKGIFRPTRNSIMNDYDMPPYSFGLWNEHLIQSVLRQLK